MRIRLLLHALDRTGPPMLALAFMRWLSAQHPDHAVETVSFWGGPMLGDFVSFGPVHVLLDPREGWDHTCPTPAQLSRAAARATQAGDADVMLAVSVAAAQVLPHLEGPAPPLVTWVIEQGDDLHWLHHPIGLPERTSRWLAGAQSTRDELQRRLPDREIHHVAEFVTRPGAIETAVAQNCRATLGQHARTHSDAMLVVGAGIATTRKAPDLFLEAALHNLRTAEEPDRFVWIGGENDPMFAHLLAEMERLGITNLRLIGNVDDVEPWLAAADVFLHTARLDAFPLVCLHATLVGTPVVTWHGNGGTAEMFADSLMAAPYPDIAALMDIVGELRDAHARSGVAAAQEQRVANHFTSDAAGPRLLEHLETVAAGTPA